MVDANTLSLADLEAYDPQSPSRGNERRFFCPLPACAGKNTQAAHRCLCARMDTGAWNCKRCHASGKLKEWWEERPKPERRAAAPRVRSRVDAATLRQLAPPPTENTATLDRTILDGLRPLDGTSGERYLSGRGISLEVAAAARVKFHPRWYGLPAAVFPIYDRNGGLVACQGRYTSEQSTVRMRDAGPKSHGVFATAGAREAETLVLVEAPIDALSLATCGLPALAVMGCELAKWLPSFCAFRSVVIATDADEGGDAAAAKWTVLLEAMGAKVRRMRPEGAKDWNELLQRDPDALRALISRILGPAPTRSRPTPETPPESRHSAAGEGAEADAAPDDLALLIRGTMRRAAELNAQLPEAPDSAELDQADAEIGAAYDAGDRARLERACAAYLALLEALRHQHDTDGLLFGLEPHPEPARPGYAS